VGESLADRRVRAVAPEDGVPHSYFVFTDGRLFRAGIGSTREELVAEVPHLQGVALYVHGPWVCVTERFGVNASLVNTSTGAVRGLSRADYHSRVSSYSIGFLDRDGRTLLVAQTEWNRLDVFDAETGANLTEREVVHRDPEKNYIDYFHSLLHVSPDSRHFLSNGWAWSPVDFVRVFSTEAFLNGYEPTSIMVSVAFGSLGGDVVARRPDLSIASPPSHGDLGSRYSGSGGWSYAPRHRVFYRWVDGAGIEEQRWR
jgi:hypothetical protein